MTAPIPTFPLPGDGSHVEELADHLDAINGGVAQAMANVQHGVLEQLTPIQQSFDTVNRGIKQRTTNMLKPINQGANGALNMMANTIGNEVSEIGVQSQMLEQMIPAGLMPPAPASMAPFFAPSPPPAPTMRGASRPMDSGEVAMTFFAYWMVFIDCDGKQVGAVQSDNFPALNQLSNSKWRKSSLQPRVAMTLAMMQQWLMNNMQLLVNQCQGVL